MKIHVKVLLGVCMLLLSVSTSEFQHFITFTHSWTVFQNIKVVSQLIWTVHTCFYEHKTQHDAILCQYATDACCKWCLSHKSEKVKKNWSMWFQFFFFCSFFRSTLVGRCNNFFIIKQLHFARNKNNFCDLKRKETNHASKSKANKTYSQRIGKKTENSRQC